MIDSFSSKLVILFFLQLIQHGRDTIKSQLSFYKWRLRRTRVAVYRPFKFLLKSIIVRERVSIIITDPIINCKMESISYFLMRLLPLPLILILMLLFRDVQIVFKKLCILCFLYISLHLLNFEEIYTAKFLSQLVSIYLL